MYRTRLHRVSQQYFSTMEVIPHRSYSATTETGQTQVSQLGSNRTVHIDEDENKGENDVGDANAQSSEEEDDNGVDESDEEKEFE